MSRLEAPSVSVGDVTHHSSYRFFGRVIRKHLPVKFDEVPVLKVQTRRFSLQKIQI